MPTAKHGKHAAAISILLALLIAVVITVLLSERDEEWETDMIDAVPENLAAVEVTVREAMKRTGVAAVSIAVAKDGEIVWEEGFGWADRKKKIRATPGTAFRVASLTKALTVTGLMVLVERDLIDLDRPANDYLVGARLAARIGDAEYATLRRLIFHTAGLPMYWNMFPQDGLDARRDIEAAIGKYGILVTPPGERYVYSNLGYGIIGHIISRASGKSYADFMREDVFEPLGMTHTSVLENPELADFTAAMYDSRKRPIPIYDFDHRGASAALSSVHDLIRFGSFHLKLPFPDQKPILSEERIDRMHSESGSSFRESEGQPICDYLLGCFAGIDYGGYRLEVATGWMPGATSRLALVPSENLVTAVLCNGNNIDLWDIEKALLEAMLPGFSDEEGTSAEEPSIQPETRGVSPADFAGSWSGEVSTYTGTIPIRIIFSKNGRADLTLGKKILPALRIATPLGEMGFQGNVFKGLYRGRIDTPDAARASHIIMLECSLRDRRLTGYLAAVAVDQYFCLPYWIELERKRPDQAGP
jgi:CubicO group peptidase (beta-lactamase class C family)